MTGEQQLAFMHQLAAIAPQDAELFVTGEWHGAPSKPVPWQDWPWDRTSCSFRSLLPNECLFDLDQPTWTDVVQNAQQIEDRLIAVDCPHYIYNSGGKGLHIHVFLEALGIESVASWKQLRLRLWEWATHVGGISDRVKVAWSHYSVVRTEGALRRPRPKSVDDLFGAGGTFKSYHESIPTTRPQPTEPRFPDRLVTFRLPVPFLLTVENENGLGDCSNCDLPLSDEMVSYDDWDDRIESLTCAVCRSRQRQAAPQHPLSFEWRYALPESWLP